MFRHHRVRDDVLACCAPTQLCTAVVLQHPGEDRVLGEVVAAAVGQVVEVEQVLVVAQVATLPLQHVALRRVLRYVVLWATWRQENS